jgi:polysaccharide biosynthesis protein PslG
MRSISCAALAVFLFLLVLPLPAHAQTSTTQGPVGYGVAAHPWNLQDRDFREAKSLGVSYVRMDFVWVDFEPTRDATFVFSKYDRFVASAKANALQIVATIPGEVPTWLRPAGGAGNSIPSGDKYGDFVTQFGQFVFAVVGHYKNDVTYFEIWNEANIKDFWNDAEATLERDSYNRGQAITKYVTLLKEAYNQAKAANPNCKIISSGLSANDYVYVQGMYENGAKGYFDFLGLHPYFWHGPALNYDPDYVDWNSPYYEQFPKISLVRDKMVANGDDAKKIFITELGVSTADGPQGSTTEQIQADRLKRVFEKILRNPGYPFVEAVMWYQLRDYASQAASCYGLLNLDYAKREMYFAYMTITKGSLAVLRRS